MHFQTSGDILGRIPPISEIYGTKGGARLDSNPSSLKSGCTTLLYCAFKTYCGKTQNISFVNAIIWGRDVFVDNAVNRGTKYGLVISLQDHTTHDLLKRGPLTAVQHAREKLGLDFRGG